MWPEAGVACRSLQPASCLGRRCCGPGLTPREPAAPITRPSRTLNPSPFPRAAPPSPSRTPAAGPCSAGAAPSHGDKRCRLDRPQDRAQALAQPAPAQPVWLASRGAAGPQLTPGSEKWVTLQRRPSRAVMRGPASDCPPGAGLRQGGLFQLRPPLQSWEVRSRQLGSGPPSSPQCQPRTLLFAPPARPPPSPPALCAASTSSAPADSSVHPGPAPQAGTSVRAPGGVPDGPPHTPPHWAPGLPPSVGDALPAPCSPPVHAPRVGSWGPILSHVLCSQAHPASLPTPTTLQGLPSGPASPADR